ncbi:hypothetical protein QVD17_37042 [Tagetes erecta]|uniref:PGG domain-containing protein n=1 Tax=Tagetes erecta TaxID=13708 RepID=A0AAD8NCF0_TARER|nr:hypothetical protein QVD17_37042 [Tagetes erecta]
MAQTATQFASIVDDKLIGHHQLPPKPQPPPKPQQPPPSQPQQQQKQQRFKPNLPRRYLTAAQGSRDNYLKIGVPLYEAAIKCNWNAAKIILDKKPELVRFCITENGETALHVAASAKGDPKVVKEFVNNLVEMMTVEDLELENENFNTALYLAAVTGNVETVKIMVEKNKKLLTIPGAKQTMMPLYAAALFGNYDVVKYLYANSDDLCDAEAGWTDKNRGWLLEKCVENDMFDIALEIVKKYPILCSTTGVLGILAGKPEAFPETKSSIVEKTIKASKDLYSRIFVTHQPSENKHPEPDKGSATENKPPEPDNGNAADQDLPQKPKASPKEKFNVISRFIKSVFEFIGSKVRVHKKKNNALPLLKIIWEDNIVRLPKKEIDRILRGNPDPIKQDKLASGRVAQSIQLQKLIYEHLKKLEADIKEIKKQFDSTTQVTDPPTPKVDHAQQLKDLISEYLVNLQIASQRITKQGDTLVVGKEDQALELQKLISEHIVNMHHERHIINKQSRKEDLALELQKLIFRYIKRMRDQATIFEEATTLKETYSSRVLFIAARMGNTTFLIQLIRQYPDLIWKVNDNGLSIFHIAVKYRHEGIYNLLYEIGAMKDMITPLKDEQQNNMLHLVGRSAKQKQLQDVSGVALQMQRELLWFQEVRNMIPPAYRERKNKDDLTPHELFTLDHKELVKQGEEWMKGTASQCMVVATLIATIVFAAAFTVPGGYRQTNDKDNGIPAFRSKATFIVFVVADAISLFTSTASILIFLSILTSRYAENDFLESLPIKLVSGLLTLFLSITTMTVVFGVSFFVLYHKGLLWMPILICVLGLLPVILYICLQFGLFYDVFRSTYRSRYLFKPKKRALYYENPTV